MRIGESGTSTDGGEPNRPHGSYGGDWGNMLGHSGVIDEKFWGAGAFSINFFCFRGSQRVFILPSFVYCQNVVEVRDSCGEREMVPGPVMLCCIYFCLCRMRFLTRERSYRQPRLLFSYTGPFHLFPLRTPQNMRREEVKWRTDARPPEHVLHSHHSSSSRMVY